MMDPSLLGMQLPAANTQVFPQALPSDQASGASRFQEMLSAPVNEVSGDSVRLDQPVLQRIDDTQGVEQGSGFKDALIEKISGMDNSYHSIMDQLKNRPSFSEYTSKLSDGDTPAMRTYPVVSSSGGDDMQGRMDHMIDSMKQDNAAAIEYQRDMSSWAMNFQMWSSGVDLVSSMVSQVSKGFQTLFRASG